MKKEDTIKEVVLKIENNQTINRQEISLLLSEYILDRKGIEASSDQFVVLQQVFGINNMIESAVSYYKNKYSAANLFSKEGSLIKTWF